VACQVLADIKSNIKSSNLFLATNNNQLNKESSDE